jgi:hypothetical protein
MKIDKKKIVNTNANNKQFQLKKEIKDNIA